MRTATSLLAALALTACGTSTESSLETQGLVRDVTELSEPAIPAISPISDIRVVTVEGLPRIEAPDAPAAAVQPEEDAAELAPEEPGEAGASAIDRAFDPNGACSPEPVERSCPSPYTDAELTEVQEEQLGALAMACEAWMKRGPASYAMDITELHVVPEVEESEIQIDATVCSGATVAAIDVEMDEKMDAKTVASIDNLFFAAADHVIDGEQIEVTVDPNLSYITRMTVITGGEPEPELFEITTRLRPIGSPAAD